MRTGGSGVMEVVGVAADMCLIATADRHDGVDVAFSCWSAVAAAATAHTGNGEACHGGSAGSS